MQNTKLTWKTLSQNETPSSSNDGEGVKNKKYFLPILFALIVTTMQVALFKACHQSVGHHSSSEYAVVVSKENIHKGQIITDENTKLVYIGISDYKDKFILNSDFAKFKNHASNLNIDANTPILKNLISFDSQDNNLQDKIPPGKRFYTLEADLSSVSSLIKVGDVVDVIAHMDINGFGKATETILNGVKIIGIGNDFDENSTNPDASSLSFYLSPEEVKILSFMKSYSQFSIALRNPNDHDISDSESVTFNKFLENKKIQRIIQDDTFKIIEGNKVKSK